MSIVELWYCPMMKGSAMAVSVPLKATLGIGVS